LFDCFDVCLFVCLADWLAMLVDWFAWLVVWLIGLVVWFGGCLIGRLTMLVGGIKFHKHCEGHMTTIQF
jgi:hypothetical protein